MTTPQTPAGWYSDPDGSGGRRYWDGHGWTEHQAPPPQAPPRAGAHRAPEDLPEPDPAQAPAEAATVIPMSPPPTSSPHDAGEDGHRQLLMRYLAVCAALLAVLVAVVVYAAFFAGGSSVSIGASDDPTPTAGGGWGEAPTDTTVTPTFPEDSDATDGPMAFSVNTVEITPSISSVDYPVEKTAVGEYVVVHLTVTNTGDEPVMFLGAYQKLTADGDVYTPDNEATFYAQGARADLDPGDQSDVAVVFDVPPGSDPETIELHADPLSPGVEVQLP